MTCETMTAAVSNSLLAPLVSMPERCLVGVSGGIDSVVLLHALVAAGKQPVVLHFDHGWRVDSTHDVAFVRELAAQLGLKFLTARAPRAAKNFRKTEQTARIARWSFFSKAATKFRCHDLLLAHNADDQVETFLLQLLRGSGSGARGMRPTATRGTLQVHRPWLGVWRKEITLYAKKNKLRWREDSTNRDTHHRRNWLRLRLMPYLQKNFSDDVPRALWRSAEILGAESEWLDSLSTLPTDSGRLSVKTLRLLPLAQARRTIRHWLAQQGIADVSFSDVEAVRGLLFQTTPAKINLTGGCHARRRAGFLFLE